jgi:putative membrane protein
MVIASALGVFALWYAAGVARAWHAANTGRGVRVQQVWAFGAALSVLFVALLSPLDRWSDESFAVHMTQHLLLAVVAPPLLVAGAPELAMFWALPLRWRRRFGRIVAGSRARAVWHALTSPINAVMLHAVAIWMWHAPRLYDLALRNEVVHAAEHMSFLITGVLLWWRILRGVGDRRAAYGTGIAALFVTAMHTGILGALITLSSRILYVSQTQSGGLWGLAPQADQELAGLLMWVVGGVLYVAAMSVLFIKWLDPPSRRTVQRRAATAAVAGIVSLAGCKDSPAVAVAAGDVARGRAATSEMGCGACHVIAGLEGADGRVGPPLAGVRNRAIIGGALPNTPENMMLWIEDPPSIAPNTAMPNLGVSRQQARDIVSYLYSLK